MLTQSQAKAVKLRKKKGVKGRGLGRYNRPWFRAGLSEVSAIVFFQCRMFLGSIFQEEITPQKVPVWQEKRGISLSDFKWSEFTYRSPEDLPGFLFTSSRSQRAIRRQAPPAETFHLEHFTSSRLLLLLLPL